MSRAEAERRGGNPCRPRDMLERMGGRMPGAWAALDGLRQARGAPDIGDWPDWCYLPLAASYAVISGGGNNRLGPDEVPAVSELAALAAWRITQGIYRFDPDVYAAVVDTPVTGDIPHDVLLRMPEWCVYIETPGMDMQGVSMHGFFAHLEFDVNTSGTELRMVADTDDGPQVLVLHLGAWSLDESLRRMGAKTRWYPGSVDQLVRELRPLVEPLVSLLLYICSQASEVGDGSRRPENPAPKRTKRGMRLFAADRPTQWDVGVRMGAALRRAHMDEPGGTDGGADRSGPRPHVRRAHWHGYWSGPKAGPRRFDLRWQPPIAVGVDHSGLPAVIRPVR